MGTSPKVGDAGPVPVGRRLVHPNARSRGHVLIEMARERQ